MLKHRLLFGVLIAAFFTGLVIFDGWLDGSVTANPADDWLVKGTLLCVIVAILLALGQLELAKLARSKGIEIFTPVTIPGSMLLATVGYWREWATMWVLLVIVLSLCGVFILQKFRYGVKNVIANCGASTLAIMYLGGLAAFVPGIRVDFGVWAFLMVIFVVKAADIGAYTVGSLAGRHKFSPIISPKKTWEGMAGAVALAMAVSVVFGVVSGIMTWYVAALFGVAFAFIGQLGDLMESMIKRDAEQKDASQMVPGFGGILDVVDSLLLAAPFAYIFLTVFAGQG